MFSGLVLVLVLLLAVLVARPLLPWLSGELRTGSSVDSGPGWRVADAGPSGGVGPTERRCRGVPVAVTDRLQSEIDRRPPGTTFCLAPGTHRVTTPVAPRRGDALVGLRGAVLSGSKVVTGWVREGTTWTARGFLPSTPGTHGACRPEVPTCTWTEDVFLDGLRLARVPSRADVVPGSVHADYASNRITIGDDPAGHLVEQAVAPGLVRATVDDVTVANLVLEQAANEAQTGAVENRRVLPRAVSGSGWRLLDNEVRSNHGVGLGFGGGSTVIGNHIHHQGQLGFGAWGTGSVVRGNDVSFNGIAGYTAEWEAGGCKIWKTLDTTLSHNDVHDNEGPGLWADGGNLRTTYERNRIRDNWGAGIQHEISYDATIVHNEITGNGRRHKGWAWEAGIQIQSSGGTGVIEVAQNVVSGNANGIVLIDSGGRHRDRPTPYGEHLVRNVWVHDNRVTLRGGQVSGAVQDIDDQSIYTANNNRFDHNVYRLDSLTRPHFAWLDEDIDWNAWRSLGNGNDLNSRVELTRQRTG